jgi:hypothetical protein
MANPIHTCRQKSCQPKSPDISKVTALGLYCPSYFSCRQPGLSELWPTFSICINSNVGASLAGCTQDARFDTFPPTALLVQLFLAEHLPNVSALLIS